MTKWAVSVLTTSALMLMGVTTATASVTLKYVGDDFTTYETPYSGIDHVSATVELTTALGDNLTAKVVSPVSFDLFDGVNHITNVDYNEANTLFQFWTDGNGNITNWAFQSWDDALTKEIQSANYFLGVRVVHDAVLTNAGPDQAYANVYTPGTWNGTAAVPEPALWAELLVGLGAIGAAFRMIRRVSSATLVDSGNAES